MSYKTTGTLLLTLAVTAGAAGAAPPAAELKAFTRHASQPTLTLHLPPADIATGADVVICPGGGYGRVVIDKEGHDIARWLNTLGVAGAVLKYHLPNVPGNPRPAAPGPPSRTEASRQSPCAVPPSA